MKLALPHLFGGTSHYNTIGLWRRNCYLWSRWWRLKLYQVSVSELEGGDSCHETERWKNRLMKKMCSRTKCDAKRWVKYSPLYFFLINKTGPLLWKQREIRISIKKTPATTTTGVCQYINLWYSHTWYIAWYYCVIKGTVKILASRWTYRPMHAYIHTWNGWYIPTYIHTWKVYGHTYVYAIHTYVPMYLDETRYPWRYEQGDSRMTRNMSSEN